MADDGDLIGGRYRRVAKLGTGAMGVVWHAKDTVLHRDVAVKQLLALPSHDDVHARQAHNRAMREGRIAAQLHHPNAITVYDMVEHDNTPCLVMEFLRARNLGDMLRDGPALAVRETAAIGRQIASALAAAHAAGIVHRDVKPGNILLTDDGTAKLTDFGIARATGDATLTATGMVVGTPAYLAPEVARGREATWRSDVFSLGATLYAAVEGTPPFGTDENPIAQLHRVATEDITPPRKAGPLTGPLLAMLQRDPDKRPRAREVVDMLAAIADGRESDDAPRPLPRTAMLPAEPSPPAEEQPHTDRPDKGARRSGDDRSSRPMPSWAKPAGRKSKPGKAIGAAALAAGAAAKAAADSGPATPASRDAGNEAAHPAATAKTPPAQPESWQPPAAPTTRTTGDRLPDSSPGRPADSQSTGSQATGSQATGSQATPAQSTAAQATAVPAPAPSQPAAPPAPPADNGRIRLPWADRPLPAWVRRRTAIVAAVVVLLLLGAILAAVLVQPGSSPVVVAPAAAGTTAPPQTAAPPTASPHGTTAPAVPPATTPRAQPTIQPTTPSTSALASQSATPASAAPGDPASAIVEYYAIAPSDPTEGWTWLTPGYQQSSGGLSYYLQFWSQFQSVNVSDITTTGTTVVATLDYQYKTGGTDHERRSFTLVQQNGRWLIADSSVVG